MYIDWMACSLHQPQKGSLLREPGAHALKETCYLLDRSFCCSV